MFYTLPAPVIPLAATAPRATWPRVEGGVDWREACSSQGVQSPKQQFSQKRQLISFPSAQSFVSIDQCDAFAREGRLAERAHLRRRACGP